MVAGKGFEPLTFWLWAKRATTALSRDKLRAGSPTSNYQSKTTLYHRHEGDRLNNVRLLPAATFVNFVIPSVLVVISAIVAKAIIVNAGKSFIFVTEQALDG